MKRNNCMKICSLQVIDIIFKNHKVAKILIECHINNKYYHMLVLIRLMLVFYLRFYIGCGIPCDMQLLHVCLPKE